MTSDGITDSSHTHTHTYTRSFIPIPWLPSIQLLPPEPSPSVCASIHVVPNKILFCREKENAREIPDVPDDDGDEVVGSREAGVIILRLVV